jgi:hypothetical protein
MRRLVERLAARADDWRDTLQSIELKYGSRLRAIPTNEEVIGAPYWTNGWIPGLDGACLYAFVADRNPQTYFEVGSGNSTKFVRQAITDHNLQTRIVSVDPSPRAEVDQLCDEVLRVVARQSG